MKTNRISSLENRKTRWGMGGAEPRTRPTQQLLLGQIPRQAPRSVKFNTIIINANLNIGRHQIIAVHNAIHDDFTQCFKLAPFLPRQTLDLRAGMI